MIAFADPEPKEVVKQVRPHAGKQEAFMSTSADIAIYGGAAGGGKTFAELMEPLRHIGNPEFRALILRRTTPEITNPGGLWDESAAMYPMVGGEQKIGSLSWEFPSGARVKFDHMQHDNDKFKYQGSQIPLIEFDELTHFLESQFWYMLSRSRSTCGVRPYVRATCNPDASSWVADLVDWWIDDEGYPIEDRSGVVRYFARVGGVLIWGDSPAEVVADQPAVALEDVKSLTFIAATLEDNPTLSRMDPGYRANLRALPYVERMRLEGGNWKVIDSEGAEWPPEYFENIWGDVWPEAFEISCVVVDPSLGKKKDSDYSAIVFLGLTGGKLWVDADIRRRAVPAIIEDTGAMMVATRAQLAGFEANGFQELLAPEFERYCVESGLPPYPVELIGNYGVKKETRIRRLGGWLKGKRIKLRRDSEGCELLLRQMQQFPLGDHDDGPDALEMAIRMLNLVASQSHQPTEEYIEA